jgi:phosphate:Na+ symporter
MLESLANVVAGLGLFFAGIWFLSENLKRATSRRFRQAVVTWTREPAAGFCVGAVAGALTQSMSVTVFILVGMVRAGLVGVRNALPLIAGANQGHSVLVFVATLETKLVMLYHLSERFFWLLAHIRIDAFARLDKA